MNNAQNGLTPADVTGLCTAAAKAWNDASPKTKRAAFRWNGKTYVASHTNFRLLVHTARGEPVACRYD